LDANSYSGRENLEVMKSAFNYNRFLLNLINRNAKSTLKILDYGAGLGTFASELANSGLDIACLEPDDSQRGLLIDAGLETYSCSDEISAGSFDYVYSLNVFEHIEDDVAALKEAHRVLKPGGQLFIYVPAFNVLFGEMDRMVGHHRRYTLKSLLDLVENGEFTINEAKYADSLGFFLTLLYNLISGSNGNVSAWSVQVYDSLLFPVSRFIDIFTCRLFGKNVYISATKQGQ